jgi:hypothetical protein
MVYLFHVLAVCAAGGHILTPTKTYGFCHGQSILAVVLDAALRHTSKKKLTHY